jgi:hypothetical protein
VARVSGLTPQERTGSGGNITAGSRAQIARDRAAPDLAPRAAPVSVYSTPEDNTQAAGSDLRQLAAALGNLNPALRGFAGDYADEARKEQEQAAENKIGGMTFEEAEKGVREGTIGELQNPWFKAAFMKQFGQRVALRKAQELADQYSNGFNKEGGNVEQLVAGTAKPVLDQYGNDRHFSSGFNNVFAPAAAKIRNEQAAHQSNRVATEVRQGVYEIGTAMISQGIGRGDNAEKIVADLRSTYAGNKQLLKVPYAEQDAEVFRMATTLTQGISTSANPKLQMEIVQRLLNDDRVAPDGYKLGSLANNRLYADKAVKVLDAADKELRQRNHRDAFDGRMSWDEKASQGLLGDKEFQTLVDEHQSNPGRYSDEFVISMRHKNDAVLERRRSEVAVLQEKARNRSLAEAQHNEAIGNAAALSGQGNLWAVKDTEVIDEDGNRKTLKADKIRDEVVSNFLRRSASVAKERGEQPAQTFDREVGWFGANGQENPQWSSLLKTGYMQGTASSLSGNKLPQAFDAASDLYNQLYAKNPALLKKHIDSDAMDFYEAVRFGTQVAGFDKRTAAINALEVNKDPTKYESPYWKQKFDDISAAVNNSVSKDWWPDGAPDNAGEIAPQIEQSAKYFSKLGASPKVAIEEAQKRITTNYVNVNNYLVRTGDRAIPASFPTMAKKYIDDYVAKYGEKEGVTASDLTVQPIGNGAGQWRIVMKRSPGMIVDHADGIFDLPKLMDVEKARTEKEQGEAVKRLNEQKAQELRDRYSHFDREEYVLTNPAAGIGKADRARREKELSDFRKKYGSKPPQ